MAACVSTIALPTSAGNISGACWTRLGCIAETSALAAAMMAGPSLRFMRPMRIARSTSLTSLARARSAAMWCFSSDPTAAWLSMAPLMRSMPKRPTPPTSIVASTAPPADTIILPQMFIGPRCAQRETLEARLIRSGKENAKRDPQTRIFSCDASRLRQGLRNICQQVLGALDACRQAQQVARNRRARAFDRGTMLEQALDPAQRGGALAQLDPRGASDGRGFAALHADGEHATEAAGHLSLCEFMLRV